MITFSRKKFCSFLACRKRRIYSDLGWHLYITISIVLWSYCWDRWRGKWYSTMAGNQTDIIEIRFTIDSKTCFKSVLTCVCEGYFCWWNIRRHKICYPTSIKFPVIWFHILYLSKLSLRYTINFLLTCTNMRTKITAWKNAWYCLKSGKTCLNISDFKYLAIVFKLYLDFLQLYGCIYFNCNRKPLK